MLLMTRVLVESGILTWQSPVCLWFPEQSCTGCRWAGGSRCSRVGTETASGESLRAQECVSLGRAWSGRVDLRGEVAQSRPRQSRNRWDVAHGLQEGPHGGGGRVGWRPHWWVITDSPKLRLQNQSFWFWLSQDIGPHLYHVLSTVPWFISYK